MICDTTDFVYPMLADIYYPTVEQSGFGNVIKTWALDATVACNFASANTRSKKELLIEQAITSDIVISGRTRRDIRISENFGNNSITNVLVTNIRDRFSNVLYIETTGVRSGQPTLFEIATIEPSVGAFGVLEFYNVILRRSDNQAVTL